MDSRNLLIRESVFEDCVFFAKWEQSDAVTEYFTMDEGRNYEQVVTEFVRDRLDPSKKQFTIVLRESNEPIGRIYLSKIDTRCDSLDVTRLYIADPDNRNKGYGEQALRDILDYAFINLHMERVTIDYFVKNKAAAYLYDKIGFKNEGIMRNAAKKNGKYYDLQLKSMLRAEYYENHHTN